MASVNMSIRTDSELKAQAEAILSQLGMTMNGTINMFLHQIVRDKAVPLSLSLTSEQGLYADLLAAQAERTSGYTGRTAADVLADMDQIIADAETRVQSDAVHCHFCQQSGCPAFEARRILSAGQYPRSKGVPH